MTVPDHDRGEGEWCRAGQMDCAEGSSYVKAYFGVLEVGEGRALSLKKSHFNV